MVVENDGNVAAWAEFRYGAARDATDSMALVTRRHRASAAASCSAGNLSAAPTASPPSWAMSASCRAGSRAGCGRQGCLEQYASGTALVRYARERAEADPAERRAPARTGRGSVEP